MRVFRTLRTLPVSGRQAAWGAQQRLEGGFSARNAYYTYLSQTFTLDLTEKSSSITVETEVGVFAFSAAL